MKKLKNILFGILFILIGVILALNAIGITTINIFFDGWWTLLIIVPALVGLFDRKSSKTTNLIFLLLGIILLLGCRKIISFGMILKLILPTILIAIGISIIFKDTFNKKINQEIKKISKIVEKQVEYNAVFSGQDIKMNNNESFNNATLNAIFGGINIDLTNMNVEDNKLINCYAIFGGIDIIVPENVNVEIKSSSLFGGVSNKKENKNVNDKTIYINSICMFGGVDIK